MARVYTAQAAKDMKDAWKADLHNAFVFDLNKVASIKHGDGTAENGFDAQRYKNMKAMGSAG